jgi:hypothetical protein
MKPPSSTQNSNTSAPNNHRAIIFPFKEATVEAVTETRKRITFGLHLVKTKREVLPKYQRIKWNENRRI